MKKNEILQSFLLNLSCNYTHIVLGSYNTVLSSFLYSENKEITNMSYPIILTGNTQEKGSKFILGIPNINMLMFYEVSEIIIIDYYSRFKYFIYKTIPKTFQYIHLLEIRYINENQCDIRLSLIYDKYVFSSVKEFKEVITSMIRNYRTIELSLRNYLVRKISNSFTTINSNIELIWNVLRNMKMVHKYINLLGNKISYNGEVLKKKDIIEIIHFKKKEQFKLIAKVNKCKSIKKDIIKECIIELLFQDDYEYNNYDLSLSKIIIKIYEFEGKCTMHILYFFVYIQELSEIAKYNLIKNNELNKFKQMIERYKEYSNSVDIKK